MGGDAHVLVVQIGGKRMGADRHHTFVKVKADVSGQETPQLLLLLLRVIAGQKAVVDFLFALRHLFQKRHQLLLQDAEEAVQIFHIKALLVGVQHHIVELLPVLCPVTGEFLLILDHFLQGGREAVEIVILLCLGPHGRGLGHQPCVVLIFVPRNAVQLFQLVRHLPDVGRLDLVQSLLRLQFLYQRFHPVVGYGLEIFAGQGADHVAGQLPRLLWRQCFVVPLEQGHGCFQRHRPVQVCFKLLICLAHVL